MRLLVTGGAGFIGSNFVESILKSEIAETITVFDSLTYAADPQKMAFFRSVMVIFLLSTQIFVIVVKLT